MQPLYALAKVASRGVGLHATCSAQTAAACTALITRAAFLPTFASGICTSPCTPTEEASGPGPGSRTRSVEQAASSGETSTTSGPESQPARSPDAPADPADLAGNRGSDPDRVIRTAAWQADQAMASSYQNLAGPDTGGSYMDHAPQMAGRFAEKVAGAAGVAAQAASGAVSAMTQTVKAATGAAAGIDHGHPDSPLSRADANDSKDQSPVSDNMTVGQVEAAAGGQEWGEQVPDTNSDTAGSGGVDTAGGTSDPEMLQRKTEQGGYRQAADRLMDIEGLPKDSDKHGKA